RRRRLRVPQAVDRYERGHPERATRCDSRRRPQPTVRSAGRVVERVPQLHRGALNARTDLGARPRAERDPHLRDTRLVELRLAQFDLHEDLAFAGVDAFGFTGAPAVDLELVAVRPQLPVDLAARFRVGDA